jgi:2-polyprenyl-3-methyl-5-hydroxy-6-metoxy-1,4-benzoquinol methylase
MSSQELDALQRISEVSRYSAGVMPTAIRYCHRLVERYGRGRRLLEMGPAEGVMTELLATSDLDLTVVEGSALFCDSLRRRFPTVKVVHSLFEDFQPPGEFDTIVLGHVLEHVEDPVGVLRPVRQWLAPGGVVFGAVPNARSLHRQAAVVMGLLPQEDAMNGADIHHGHRRVFNPESFRSVFVAAGLRVDVFGGYWLKPISNGQLEKSWTQPMLDAYMQLGERYPDIAGEIYVVASNP